MLSSSLHSPCPAQTSAVMPTPDGTWWRISPVASLPQRRSTSQTRWLDGTNWHRLSNTELSRALRGRPWLSHPQTTNDGSTSNPQLEHFGTLADIFPSSQFGQTSESSNSLQFRPIAAPHDPHTGFWSLKSHTLQHFGQRSCGTTWIFPSMTYRWGDESPCVRYGSSPSMVDKPVDKSGRAFSRSLSNMSTSRVRFTE